MLDQLVISRNQTQERTKFTGFMLSTGIVLVTILMIGFVVSLFQQNIVLAADSIEISILVAPVEFEPKPEPIEEPKNQPEKTDTSNESKFPTRTENVLRIEESPNTIPTSISVTPTDIKARPNSGFKISEFNFDPSASGGAPTGSGRGNGNSEVSGISNAAEVIKPDVKEEIPPPIVTKPEIRPQPPVSGGVVNGKAINLVMPVYSGPARNLGLKGQVKVQVLIDENGNVISATAVSGHALLTQSAVKAAKASTFTPTKLSEQKVKVTGIIIYNFT